MTIDFNHRHPDYLRYYKRWQMAYDFWRGGINVLIPGNETAKIRFPVEKNSSGVDSDLAATQTDFSWHSTTTNSYLFKYPSEDIEKFVERQERQIHIPVYQNVINTYSAGILKTQPTREVDNDSIWLPYWNDLDKCGTNLEVFIRNALGLSLVFGKVHALIDRPRYEKPLQNKAEQLKVGDRAYTYLINPLDLVDWETDENGQMNWAVIREAMPIVRSPGEAISDNPYQYRVWYRDGWELYRNNKKNWLPVMGDTHNLEQVPIATLYTSQNQNKMACESPLSDILDIDRNILNELSQIDEIERNQAFSILYLPQSDDSAPGPIDISPYSALVGPPDCKPEYVSPDSQMITAMWERIESKLQMVRQMAGVSRGQAENSREERSAAAISLESEDKTNRMSGWAGYAEEFEKQIHTLIAKWDDIEKIPNIQYNRKFDWKSITTEINELTQIFSLPVSNKVKEAMTKSVVSKVLKNSGVSHDKVNQVLKDVVVVEGDLENVA